ncbi:hypothetical protein A7A08_01646 [Methyloligella halotolerans]|uniref:Uncharacterized protein n=1 Tax=Methyloligella halotolerans TaxID=1177755 RepID=A0A1E2RZN6_9HYPH|nr:hypothetical protein [Methyloligella halotolerans]ODA67612.1 hypothetical protein A7A08_01646 [Methyloligella halotolerans]
MLRIPIATAPALLLLAVGLSVPPALADEAPKIEEIFTTMAEPENADTANLLDRLDGKTVYIDTVNADIAIDEHYRIAEECFPTKSAEDPLRRRDQRRGDPDPNRGQTGLQREFSDHGR